MKMKWYLLIILCISQNIFADDAVEAVATNDIVFEKPAELIMQDETLTFTKHSKKFLDKTFSVDIDFHFKNISDKDITRKIAFVLPPVHCGMGQNSMWQGLEGNEGDILYSALKDYTLTVDNKSVNFNRRVEATLDKRNITTLLNQLHVPLNPCLIRLTLEGKPDPKYSTVLSQHKLLDQDGSPKWSQNVYFEWTQTFPAGKVVHIHHHYTPIVGTTVPMPRTVSDLNKWFTDSNQMPLWNRNPHTLAETNPYTVYKNKKPNPEDTEMRFCLIPSWIHYNLKTGAYWNGGIGKLKIIIKDEAGAPFAINDFYTKSSQVQTSILSNTMEFSINRFIPTKNLIVLFLSLPQNKEDLKSCGM